MPLVTIVVATYNRPSLLRCTIKSIQNQTFQDWVSLSELEILCRTPKLLTNEARSVISVLLGLA